MTRSVTEPTGLMLQSPEGPAYRFDAGALCLELLITGGVGRLAWYEVLTAPAGLTDWARQSRLAPDLSIAATGPELAAARELREALRRLALSRAGGSELPAADLALLNEAAAEAPLVARIGTDGSYAWAPDATGTQLLSTVARDAVDLFTGPYAHRIRTCDNPDCYLVFADTSRPGRRRWCSMERCGNRAKVRTHRARHSEAAN